MTENAVAKNKVISIAYTLRTSGGDLIDESTAEEPLLYLHGASNIVPGLEKKLEGADVGATVSAVVPPDEGYGPRMGEPQEVPRSAFPEGAELEEGMAVVAQDEQGRQIPLFIVGLSTETVTVDPNHPLAGETLHFEVTIVQTRDATLEEIAHGHPHGPGSGHDH